MKATYTISVVAYNNHALTRQCVESVLANSGDDFELILSDNGSTDGSTDYFDELAKHHPRVLVWPYSHNLGFIEPNRAAFRMAKGTYFVLLNNDCVVPPGWLEVLRAPFLTDSKCAITGATGGELREDGVGGLRGSTDYIEGHCMMVRTDFVRAVEPGLFHVELSGAYAEDSYLSLQMREAGYTIHVTPIPGLLHHGGSTACMVPQCAQWHAHNREVLTGRFGHYLKNRTFQQ
jgi:GT2 family glycosyltransferase